MLTLTQLRTIAEKYAVGPVEEVENFLKLHKFLLENPELFGWQPSKKKPNLNEEEGFEKFAIKYYSKRYEKVLYKDSATIPDEMVSKILKRYFNYSQEKLNLIKKEHQQSMTVENMVGDLLERYIDSVLVNYGWIWCCASLVKKIDFIKFENQKYRLIQIKNRNSSENSSSSAIRDGTTIEKWFRTYSYKSKTNWENFPDQEHRSSLSEDGFVNYVENYFDNVIRS
jgi:hypothetical protein